MSDTLLLMMAQVDDVPGKLLGDFMRRVEELGARNVQIVPSITKKGRPGYLAYIDVAAKHEMEVGLLLGAELGTWGYRILAAEHKHFNIARLSTALTVSIGGTDTAFELRVKTISNDERRLRVKAEHDDLVGICQALRERGHDLPLAMLKAAVETYLYTADDLTHVRVCF